MSDESKKEVNDSNQTVLRSRSIAKQKTKIVAIIIAIALAIAAIIIFVAPHIKPNDSISFETILDVSDYAKELDPSWTTSSENPSISEAKIESDRGFPGYSFVIYFHKTGNNRITLSKGDEKYVFDVSISGDMEVQISVE